MTLQEKVVMYRAKHNLSMKELAEKAKVTTQTIMNLERGLQNPSRVTRAKLMLAMEDENELQHIED